MEKAGDVLKNIIPKKQENDKVSELKQVKCVNCGATVVFKPNQFRRYCSKCGISVSTRLLKKQQKQIINCWICEDTGTVVYQAQVNGSIAEYAAKCLCPEGADKGVNLPVITQCLYAPPIDLIKMRNIKMHNKNLTGGVIS